MVMVLGGKFSPAKEPFWKEPAYFGTFLFLLKCKNIWSGTSIFEGLECFLLMTKIEGGLNLVLKFLKTPKFLNTPNFFSSALQKWDLECFVFKVKTRTVKSHLPYAEILISPRSAQLAASCP